MTSHKTRFDYVRQLANQVSPDDVHQFAIINRVDVVRDYMSSTFVAEVVTRAYTTKGAARCIAAEADLKAAVWSAVVAIWHKCLHYITPRRWITDPVKSVRNAAKLEVFAIAQAKLLATLHH